MNYTVKVTERIRYYGRSGIRDSLPDAACEVFVVDNTFGSILKAVHTLMKEGGHKSKIYWMTARVLGSCRNQYYEIGIYPSPNIRYEFCITPVRKIS